MKNYEAIAISIHPNYSDITLKETVTWGFWIFKKIEINTVVYRGNCTVWHEKGTGARASTWLERFLSETEWLAKQK